MTLRATRAYALLQVSSATYAEIRASLKAAEYDDAFTSDDGREVIDMHGLALLDGRADHAEAKP